jgi:hypothetical protein
MGRWGDAMTKSPDPVGRGTRRAEDLIARWWLRAGFEPRRARGSSERLEYRLTVVTMEGFRDTYSRLSHPRRGSQPARDSLTG